MGGALDGKPTAWRNVCMTAASVRPAITFNRQAQRGHAVTSYWKTRARSLAQEIR